MEQVSEAVGNIQQASEQTATGAEQLKESASNLSDLGRNLEELVGRWKI